jgi:ABC-type antimicrobial peptide transport system permease subunit
MLASQLYEVGKFDLASMTIAVTVLILCAGVAGFLPARRAASIEPARALRTD